MSDDNSDNNNTTDPPVRPATRPPSIDLSTRQVINQALTEEPAAAMMLAAAAHTARANRTQSICLPSPNETFHSLFALLSPSFLCGSKQVLRTLQLPLKSAAPTTSSTSPNPIAVAAGFAYVVCISKSLLKVR